MQVTERNVKETDFNPDPERLRQDYLDVFEAVKLEKTYTAKYDEDYDTGTVHRHFKYEETG